MNRWVSGVTVLLIGASVGCEMRQASAPPRIRYGEAPCDTCRMLISEERTAAALRTAAGDVQQFDDIDCLLRGVAAAAGSVTHVWVHAYDAERWLNAQEAWYVMSPELMTPMGSGLAAFATQAAADEAARQQRGSVLRWADLPRATRQDGATDEGG